MLPNVVRLAAIPIALAAALSMEMDHRISGRITDAASGSAIEGVQVMVSGTGFGTITGADGRYMLRLPDTMRGTGVTLLVRRIGYTPVSRAVQLDSSMITIDFVLAAATQMLGVQTITADAATLIEAGVVGSSAAITREVLTVSQGYIAAPVPASTTGSVGSKRNEVTAEQAHTRLLPTGEDSKAHDTTRRIHDTESYDHIVDNPFIATTTAPLSTFSIDVDRASYANIRRFITAGRLPPRDAVRIEELLNYFAYAYPQPSGSDPFSVTTDVVRAPWNPNHRLVRVGLQGRTALLDTLPPSNLVFLIDVSGSMQMPDKLPLLKSAFRLLVQQLREEDRVALVVYAGAAGLVLPPTSGVDKARILSAIDALEAGGSTAGGEGLRLAYEVARQHHLRDGTNRVILATDGDFNVGVSSDAEMIRLVEEKREQGTMLTVLGFGTGNVKDSKMEKLADHGNGNYAYIDNLDEAKKTLVREIGGTLVTIAKDVKLQIEFNPSRVAGYRLIGYENRVLRDEDFADDTKDAGEMGAGHSVTALYEVVPVGAPAADSLRRLDTLRYQTPPSRAAASRSNELMHVQLRYKRPTEKKSRLLRHAVADRIVPRSQDMSFAAAVAAFGMVLRDSPYKGTASFDEVLVLGTEGLGSDEHGDRAAFLDLVRRASRIAGPPVVAGRQR